MEYAKLIDGHSVCERRNLTAHYKLKRQYSKIAVSFYLPCQLMLTVNTFVSVYSEHR